MINELKKLFGHVFEKDLLQEIALHGRLLEVAEQVELIDIGQPIKGIPLLLSGALKISREDAHGDELLLYYVEKGESCAMSFTWELNQRKSKIRAVTEVPSKIIMIPFHLIEGWTDHFPSWRRFLFKNYHRRMEEMLHTLDSLAFDKLEERLIAYLRQKRHITHNNTLLLTHQQIAEEMHSSRVVISRLLKRIEKRGAIKMHRNAIDLLESL